MADALNMCLPLPSSSCLENSNEMVRCEGECRSVAASLNCPGSQSSETSFAPSRGSFGDLSASVHSNRVGTQDMASANVSIASGASSRRRRTKGFTQVRRRRVSVTLTDVKRAPSAPHAAPMKMQGTKIIMFTSTEFRTTNSWKGDGWVGRTTTGGNGRDSAPQCLRWTCAR